MPRLFTRAGLSMIGRFVQNFVVFGLVVAVVYTLVLRHDRSPEDQHDHHGNHQRGPGDPEVRNVPFDDASEDASAIPRRRHTRGTIPMRAVRS